MKKAIVALAIAAFASSAMAAIANGPHDLSTRADVQNGFSSCQFCHAPHFANTSSSYAAIPLWNRNTPNTAAYQTNVGTANLGAGSWTCLSCHDGVADMGQTYSGSDGLTGADPIDANSYANVGRIAGAAFSAPTDLRDDHPVGVIFNAGGEMQDLATVQATSVKLYEYAVGTYTVECGSCHEPHLTGDKAQGGASLLRQTTGLCAACHAK
jgi:predicted CXXCH cytochrome family protein